MTLLRTFGLLPVAAALWYFKDPARRTKFLKSDPKPGEAVNDLRSSAVVAKQHANPGATSEEKRESVVSGSVLAPRSSTRTDWYDKYQERSRWRQFTIFSISPPTPTSENEPPEEEHWHDRGYAPQIPNPPFEDMPLDQFVDDGIDRMFDDDSDIEVNEEVGEVEPRDAVEGRAEVAVAAPNVDPPTGEASSSTRNLATQHATSSRAGSLETPGGSSSGQPEPSSGPSSVSQMHDSEEDPEPEGGPSVGPCCRPRPSGEDDQPA